MLSVHLHISNPSSDVKAFGAPTDATVAGGILRAARVAHTGLQINNQMKGEKGEIAICVLPAASG
jgi:hypothetical protein